MDEAHWRSEVPLVEHLVDPVADPLQVSAIDLGGPVQSRQEVTVSKVIEDVVDSRVALGRQVAFDGLVQQFTALVQERAHDAAVEGELDLVEADRRHGQGVDFLPEVVHQHQLLTVELVVSVEHSQLHHHLDQVLDDFLGLFAVAGVLLGHTVQLVQHFTAGVVNEEVGHALRGHLAHQLLLRLQG